MQEMQRDDLQRWETMHWFRQGKCFGKLFLAYFLEWNSIYYLASGKQDTIEENTSWTPVDDPHVETADQVDFFTHVGVDTDLHSKVLKDSPLKLIVFE